MAGDSRDPMDRTIEFPWIIPGRDVGPQPFPLFLGHERDAGRAAFLGAKITDNFRR